MPKRKRGNEPEDPERAIQRHKQSILDEITRSKKLLHRALKTAKGFERQKLSKRLKNASTPEETTRINKEIEALKGLDLDVTTETQLNRNLLKVKEIKECESLLEECRAEAKKVEGSEEVVTAVHNVVSGLCNAKIVKEALGSVVGDLARVLGVVVQQTGKKEKDKAGKRRVQKETAASTEKLAKKQKPSKTGEIDTEGQSDEGDDWEGLDSQNEDDDEEGSNADDESLDEEELQKYDALLGADSDEESFHAEDWLPKTSTLNEQTRCSFSPSPSISHSISPSLSPEHLAEPGPDFPSSSEAPPPKPSKTTKIAKPSATTKKPSKAKAESTKAGNSTFLPSLLGGYWSGSDSPASDLEDAPPTKKNRPGQQARRAIWEKKFAEKANHIKSGKGPVGKGKDDGWDAKRGATDSKDVKRVRGGASRRSNQIGAGRGGRGGGGGAVVTNRKMRRSLVGGTGENSTPIAAKSAKTRDDVGVLHPSWQAAKKAKEIKKTASFQGKKVTF